jgi:hypothetical protein
VNFTKLPNNFLDILLNVAYNQGYYGGLVLNYSRLGDTATPQSVANIDTYVSIWGTTNSYQQYLYQVRYYDDQFYNNPIPTNSTTTFATPQNHIFFSMTFMQTVFSNVFQTISYIDGTGSLGYIPSSQAQAAFAAALSQTGTSNTSSLDLSKAVDRRKIFTILESAIGNLETSLNTRFNATTLTQLP